MDARLALTPDERATIQEVIELYPDLLGSVDAYVVPLTERLILTFQGRITTEAQADELLVRVVGALASRAPGASGEPSDVAARAGTLVNLVSRHLVGQARDSVVERLLGTRPTGNQAPDHGR